MTLKPGDKAPEFTGKNQDGKEISLKDYSGKKLVLYFYPKDNTGGCTAEACNLRDAYGDFSGNGYAIVGVSPDSEKSHTGFIGKYSLPFPLIADADHSIAALYGVWGEKKMYGRSYMGIIRTTFVIDEKGLIENVIEKVDTSNHAAQILKQA
ncbi:MAG: thioredoxin-dependent thiol peroxidase [Bacteroidales bacterium]|nr:thioredoxin-dependent thiol peroxidase [Bacteroidales bacterium]